MAYFLKMLQGSMGSSLFICKMWKLILNRAKYSCPLLFLSPQTTTLPSIHFPLYLSMADHSGRKDSDHIRRKNIPTWNSSGKIRIIRALLLLYVWYLQYWLFVVAFRTWSSGQILVFFYTHNNRTCQYKHDEL